MNGTDWIREQYEAEEADADAFRALESVIEDERMEAEIAAYVSRCEDEAEAAYDRWEADRERLFAMDAGEADGYPL